jgi:hypothetical protein
MRGPGVQLLGYLEPKKEALACVYIYALGLGVLQRLRSRPVCVGETIALAGYKSGISRYLVTGRRLRRRNVAR